MQPHSAPYQQVFVAEHHLGFGLRCQQYIWEICKCAGIADLAARVTRSRNPMNTVKATVEALLSQKDPEEIASARGKKMVDVRKVYYAGLV
jgi:small subunit ribosomal protein S5